MIADLGYGGVAIISFFAGCFFTLGAVAFCIRMMMWALSK